MKNKIIKFSVLEFFFYAACATYYPYLVVYLKDMAYSNTSIGIIIAINSVVVVIAQPFWGMVSDWLHTIKKIFILCMTMGAILLLTMPLFSKLILVSLILAVITFFESALMPLLDSWVVKGIDDENNTSYGNIRLWGSVGFAITSYVIGKLIDTKSINTIFYGYAIAAIIVVLTSLKIKDKIPTHRAKRFKELNIKRLLTNINFLLFLVFTIFISIPHRASTIFMPNLITQVGGTKEDVGIVFAISAMSEIPIFLLSKHIIKRFKPVYLLLFSSIFFISRQFLYIIVDTPIQVMLVHLMQGLSFGLFITGMVYYVYEIAPEDLKSTAQSIATSVFFGIGSIIGSYGGGWIIDNYGLIRIYKIGLIICSLISIIFFIHVRKQLKETVNIK